jgi:hypothetical protein
MARIRRDRHRNRTALRFIATLLRQTGLIMGTAKTPDDRLRPLQPLQYNLALLAHLIYLARRSESNQQQRYLGWASDVIEEMQRHPKLYDEPASY